MTWQWVVFMLWLTFQFGAIVGYLICERHPPSGGPGLRRPFQSLPKLKLNEIRLRRLDEAA